MIDCKKCVHYKLCLDFVCSKQDMERDTDCDYFEEEKPHGEIITDEDGNTSCSECGQTSVFGNFCYNCGADLREGEAE